MALINQVGNREPIGLDYNDIQKAIPPKLAVLFVQAMMGALSFGYWTSVGRTRANDRGLITLRDSAQVKVCECSFWNNATLAIAVQEFCDDVAKILGARTAL